MVIPAICGYPLIAIFLLFFSVYLEAGNFEFIMRRKLNCKRRKKMNESKKYAKQGNRMNKKLTNFEIFIFNWRYQFTN